MSHGSLFCNLCLILIFPQHICVLQVWCNSVAPRPKIRSSLVVLLLCVTLTTRVIPQRSTLWTLMAPHRVSQGFARVMAGIWPWCPTQSAAPWAGSGPGPRGTLGLRSHRRHGYACSGTQLPGATTQMFNGWVLSARAQWFHSWSFCTHFCCSSLWIGFLLLCCEVSILCLFHKCYVAVTSPNNSVLLFRNSSC